MRSLYRWINTVSLDVAAGAMICAAFVAQTLGVPLRYHALACLGLTVWIIYTTDRLLDVRRRSATTADTMRHDFHGDHFGLLASLVIAAAVGVVLLVLSLPSTLIKAGMVLGAVVGAYLLLQRYLKAAKEFFAAVLYTVGVSLPSWIQDHGDLTLDQWAVIAVLFLVVYCNLLAFSIFDHEVDKATKRNSLVTVIGVQRSKTVVMLLIYATVFLTVFAVVLLSSTLAFLVLFFMCAVLLWIVKKDAYFSANDNYRLLGDAIFFMPLIAVLFGA